MQISLDSPLKRRGLLAGAGVLLILYVMFAARGMVASYLADRPELGTLRAATRIDPGNADYHYRLGRYYDLVARDQSAAIVQYQEAVRLNPHDSRFWLGLADIHQAMGDTVGQSEAIERAIVIDPTSPALAWEAANLYVSQGETEKALREFHVVLESSAENFLLAMQLSWRISPDVDLLLREVIPANRDAYFTFLDFLMTKQQTESTLKVWDALFRLQQPIDTQRVFDFVRYLLIHKEVDDAPLVWRQATALNGLGAYLPSSDNLFVNPNFNMDVLNGGFDWQYHKQSSVSLILDTNETHDGHRSVAISFDGPGISDAGIYQVIAVHPATTYEFSGYYKNGEIDGAGGPHFSLQDPYTGETFYQSSELRDAADWKNASGELTTGPDTKIIAFRVRRIPDGSPIRGKLWIADFRLVEKTSDKAPPGTPTAPQ
jgi:tetratricopeptide (TPR) repeat protein